MNWNLANRLGLKLQVQEAKLEFSVVDFSLLASRSAGDLILPIDLAKTFSYLAETWQIQGHGLEAICLSNLISFPQHNCKTVCVGPICRLKSGLPF